MAQSAVQICNMALARVGVSQVISSLSESSTEARVCSLWYEQCRDSLLQSAPWKFAYKIAALQDVGDPPLDWSYRYRYPNDCLKAIKITPDANDRVATTTSATLIKYIYEVVADTDNAGKSILCDYDAMYLHYIARVEDPTMYDALFTSALAWLIASEIALPLTADANKSKYAFDAYYAALAEALVVSSNEGYEGAENTTDLISGRL